MTEERSTGNGLVKEDIITNGMQISEGSDAQRGNPSENKGGTFGHYQLSDEICEALRILGYQTPTAIQMETIPAMLKDRNVAVKAPTGSGKTAAFAIPICEKIDWDENAPQALILEPTRELTVQVRDEIFHIGRKKRLKVPALFGGVPIDKQIQTLRQKSHIAVGTPGRVMDLIRRESLNLSHIVSVVIDEADLMLDMGFIEEVKEILDQIPPASRICLFSATLKPEIQKLVEEYATDAEMIIQEAEEQEIPAIEQKLYEADSLNKYEVFRNVLFQENPSYCMIFCATRDMVNVLYQKMKRERILCGMLHGEMDQRERLKTIENFRRGSFRFLIATDVAARGIDLDCISHVINYDFPTGRETYVHRIGRTGRNGQTGVAVSLVCDIDKRMLRAIEQDTGWKLRCEPGPRATEQEKQEFHKKQSKPAKFKPQKGAALNEGITRLTIGGGRKSKMRAGDIVGTICSIEGLTQEDIGIIDIRDSLTYVEILNQKGMQVNECLQTKPIKGKIRTVKLSRGLGLKTY